MLFYDDINDEDFSLACLPQDETRCKMQREKQGR